MAGDRGVPSLAPGGRKAIVLHTPIKAHDSNHLSRSGFCVQLVKALAGVRRRVSRERGIDVLKIAPMSGAATTNSPKRCNGSHRLRQPIRAPPPPWNRAWAATPPSGIPRLAAFPIRGWRYYTLHT